MWGALWRAAALFGVGLSLTTNLAFAQGVCHQPNADLEVCFNNKTQSIETRIRQLIAAADSGSTIRVAMFNWTNRDVARDLRDAANLRGIRVEVVSESRPSDGSEGGIKQAVLDILNQIDPTLREIVVCPDGCLSDHINHNKFFLFDDLDNRKHVVLTSQNLAASQNDLHQDLLRIRNDETLHDHFADYFERLKAQSWQGWTSDGSRKPKGDLFWSRAYLFPRVSDDPVLTILNNVELCRTHDDKVWLGYSKMDEARVSSILPRLQYLEDVLGCDVRVFARNMTEKSWFTPELSKVRILEDRHHKFMIIDAAFYGAWRNLTFTGSQNLNVNGSRRNDEAMVRIEHAGLFNKYKDHYRQLWDQAVATTAGISAAQTTTQSGGTVSFDTSGTSSGWGETYSLDFGDGSVLNGDTADLGAVAHTYTAPGTYTVTLTVVDPAGDRVEDVETIVVANSPPVAHCSLQPQPVVLHTKPVTFDASGSTDPDGSIVDYDWDFGSGSSGQGESFQHTYPNPGTYTATLTVTDNSGASSETTCQIKVGVAPIAQLSISPDPPTVATGAAVTFNGTGSSDADGAIISYSWTFGDGQSHGNGPASSNHAYSSAGAYQAKLTVTDDDGFTAHIHRWIDVGDAPQIVTQPQDAHAPIGSRAVFTVAATGSDALQYRWQDMTDGAVNLQNGGGIAGANTPMLTIDSFDLSTTRAFRCVVMSPYGQAISQLVTLSVEAVGTRIRDTFSAGMSGDLLAGQVTEVGGATWEDNNDRLALNDDGAISTGVGHVAGWGSVPFNPYDNPVLTRLSADVEPLVSGWVSLNFLRAAGSFGGGNAQFWLRITASGVYVAQVEGTDGPILASGTLADVGGCSPCRIDLEFDPLFNTVRAWIAGIEVLPQAPLGFVPDIQHVGFQFAGVDPVDPSSIDNFKLSQAPVVARDTFSDGASGSLLAGQVTEVGGLIWEDSKARIVLTPDGRATVADGVATGWGSVPFDPDEQGVAARLSADVEPLVSGWVSLNFLRTAGSFGGGNAQFWLRITASGVYAAQVEGTDGPILASGTLADVGGCSPCRVELEYDPFANTVRAWIEGIEVLPSTPLPFSLDINQVGFQLAGVGDPTNKSTIDNFQLRTASGSGAE